MIRYYFIINYTLTEYIIFRYNYMHVILYIAISNQKLHNNNNNIVNFSIHVLSIYTRLISSITLCLTLSNIIWSYINIVEFDIFIIIIFWLFLNGLYSSTKFILDYGCVILIHIEPICSPLHSSMAPLDKLWTIAQIFIPFILINMRGGEGRGWWAGIVILFPIPIRWITYRLLLVYNMRL